MSRRCLVFLSLALCASPCPAAHILRVQMSPPFDGYITRHTAPMEFDVGTTHVVCNAKTVMVMTDPRHDKKIPFDPNALRTGVAIHVEGETTDGVAVVATRLVITTDPTKPQHLEGSGNVMPSDHPGMIWADGLPLLLDPGTQIVDSTGHPVAADQLSESWIEFKATRGPANTVHATSIVAYSSRISPDEVKFRTQHSPAIVWPDYKKNMAGVIPSSFGRNLYILPDEQLQQWITRVGTSLIPKWQQDLPAGDPSKIHFRFVVLDHGDATTHIASTPDGLILVPDRVLERLHNEAQLATLMSAAMASANERYLYLNRKALRANDAIAIGSVIALSLMGSVVLAEDDRLLLLLDMHAARVGLHYALDAGYDIRDAPFAREAGEGALDIQMNPRQIETNPSDFGVMLEHELAFDYAGLNYDKLVTHQEEYSAMLDELDKADPAASKP